jgi:hypothetical protein
MTYAMLKKKLVKLNKVTSLRIKHSDQGNVQAFWLLHQNKQDRHPQPEQTVSLHNAVIILVTHIII